MKRICCGLLVILFLLSLVPAMAQDSLNVSIVARLYENWGESRSMAVTEEFVYLFTEGEGVRIIDITTPNLPVLAGEYLENPFDQYDAAAFHNDFLYYCAEGDIYVLDVSNPEQPSTVATYPSPGNEIQGLTLSGNLLFAVGEHFGIRISDISDPENPEHLGWNDVFYGCKSILVQDDIAYIPCGVGGFRSVNISNPQNMRQLNVVGGDFRHAVINGDVAYLTASRSGVLYCVNISNPEEMAVLGESDEEIPGVFYGLAGNENYFYVCNGSLGIRVFDVSAHESPFLASTYSFSNVHVGSEYLLSPIILGNSLFVADNENHLMIYDISDPIDLALEGNLTYNPRFSKLVLDNNTVRLHDINQGLLDFDVQDPSSSERLSTLYLSTGDLKQVITFDSHSVISDHEEVHVYEDHDLLISWAMTGFVTAMSVVNQGLMVGLQTGKVVSFDLSDLLNPVAVDSVNLPGTISCLVYNEPYLHVTSDEGQLTLYDLDEDYTFIQRGLQTDLGVLTSCVGAGAYVYCASDSSSIQILNINNPENIVLVDDVHLNMVHELKIYEGYLIALTSESGFRIYSLVNPEVPELVGSYMTPGEPHDLLVESGYAYLADGEYFEVFDVSAAIVTNQLAVSLRPNYFNLVCTPYIPPLLDAFNVFGDITGLQIVYDEDGAIFLPPDINTIGDIDPSRSWQVFTTDNTNWIVHGDAVPLETPYTILSDRWNWIGHPFVSPVAVDDAYPDEVEATITVLISDNGHYWIPSLGINTLEVLTPGRGLITHSYEDITFQYNAAAEGAPTHIYEDTHNNIQMVWQEDYISLVRTTGKPYPVILKITHKTDSNQVFHVYLYDGAKLVGYYEGLLESQFLPLTAWEEQDGESGTGFSLGNPIIVEICNESGELLYRNKQGVFGYPPYALIEINTELNVIPPESFQVISLSPNPFNDKTTLTFFLPEKEQVSVTVSNLLGQTIYKDVSTYNPGKHDFTFHGEPITLASGIYFVKICSGAESWTGKMLYLR